MTTLPLIVEYTYKVLPDKVWDAITNNASMKQWYFELKDFKAEKGFTFSFYGQGSKGEQYLHLCEVQDVIVNKKLSYSWCYQDMEGKTKVSFDLFDKGNETIVRLTHEGLDTFPQGNPDFARESFSEGWNYILGTSLKNFLEPIK